MRNHFHKLLNLAVRASTKTTFLFFSAIAATIGGGLLSVFHLPGAVPEKDYAVEVRVPASASASAQPLRFQPPRVQPAPSPYGGGMPANYDERANAQNLANVVQGGEQMDASQLLSQQPAAGLQSQAKARALAGAANALPDLDPEATSTSTSTSSSTDTATTFNNSGPSTATATSSDTDTATATSSGARFLSLSAEGTGIPGLCIPLTLTFYDSSLVATAPGTDVTVSLFNDLGTLYSNGACTAAASSVTLAAASASGTFYFRHTAAGTATIRAEHTSYSTSSMSITLSVPSASIGLGQASFTGSAANAGGAVAANSLNEPYRTLRTGSQLIAADAANNRVLIWTTTPTSTQQAADLVIGQPDLVSDTANNGGISGARLSYPTDVHTDGTRLFVADAQNNRVLIWNTIPTTLEDAADLVLGQPDMTSNTANQGGGASLATLSDPECVFTDGTSLLVCDTGNHRVLLWNSIPTSDNQPADVVIGQANGAGATANQGGAVSASGLDGPYFAAISGAKLLVSDTNNNRVLVWDSLPTSHGGAATTALGQESLTANTNNSGGVSASSLSSPAGLAIDSQGRLAVVDFNNHRLLLWNSIPTAHFTEADSVVGQSLMTTNAANNGGISASTLNGPWGVDISGNELWIADWGNHRVLQFTMP